jgi:hypothetical protein
MNGKTDFTPYLVRFVIVLLVSLVLVAAFNEGTHLLQREDHDRAPEVIQLVIPKGAAERIASGETVPSIPEEMVFVVGDTLEVMNEDSAVHQLGPLTVPPGATARMLMEQANKYAYSCSFQPSRYLGLDVRQGTTLSTRLTGLVVATPATVAFLFIYSLAAFPIRSRQRESTEQTTSRQV